MYYNKFFTMLSFWKKFGFNNLLYFLFTKNQEVRHWPGFLPIFGIITNKEEIRNIRDNIFQGSLRDQLIEKIIKKTKNPIIIDCGINIGVTVRWWFYLNPSSIVYGIDMMREAHEFTLRSLSEKFKKSYIPITLALAADNNQMFKVQYNEPLFGANSVKSFGEHERNVCSSTLDECLRKYCSNNKIDLMKVDIEGSAAAMFSGATQSLKRIKHIFLEWHDDDERDSSISLLAKAGFFIRKRYKRHIWFENLLKC
ncbi:MAG: hypothetical protein A2Y03_03320 [Omnitrophica WOR_2 bacterium GWF2_38_59]|nr:MAG: hypothetical protein A2Y03_03320 [Omnitrophica WOR_2 bacterium GWF2_38_59]OGX50277.1 MAG: hypothetical protein A2243_07215 [Omnitrophica WOR_2 bacterium RIFOXYA2_FULL_38_17]OGX54397.1 MAG: hypothetical protein A2267_01005 [Omnitrophica WOR_2 bacterium RIFOXYA12_FULL_38_10]OGX58916.1 MAG: hypothetical protein A2447_11000 [Omnitrophica WOR_2 bacterium RIFOXYC2_FULL_38_12]